VTTTRNLKMNSKDLLEKLMQTQGPLSVNEGVLWFEDGVSVDLSEVASASSAVPVAFVIESEHIDKVVVIAPQGMGIVESDALAVKVKKGLISAGTADDLGNVLDAYEKAGFQLPAHATVSLEA